jgi:hypothetical protein
MRCLRRRRHERRLRAARAACGFSPLSLAIAERFLEAYLRG